MEFGYKALVSDLQTKDKHIIQLQSQLLRIDYEYGIIVKDLKFQYQNIIKICRKNDELIKQLQQQNTNLKIQHNNTMSKILINQQIFKRLEQQIGKLKNIIKFQKHQNSKLYCKIQDLNQNKKLLQRECHKYNKKIMYLEKQVKISHAKKKQLQLLVEQQVLQTKQRVQNIGLELLNRQYLDCTKKNLQIVQQQQLKQTKPNIISPPPQQLINDWQSDMKKLKNCIDYGNNYILVFDPMNLDRTPSRQIFKFFKTLFKQKQSLLKQIQQLQFTNKKIVNDHKNMLNHFQKQLQKLQQSNLPNPTTQKQAQTQTQNQVTLQKTIFHLNQLNIKLKIKNKNLIQCLDYITLKNVITHNLLYNSYLTKKYQQYYRKYSDSNKLSIHSKTIKKFRIAGFAVFFIFAVKNNIKSQAWNQDTPPKSPLSTHNTKLRQQTSRLQKLGIKNMQLQKLKDTLIINSQSLQQTAQQIISYYQFKMKDHLQSRSIIKQLLNHKFFHHVIN